jgi:arylsulfatase A-like enzyme
MTTKKVSRREAFRALSSLSAAALAARFFPSLQSIQPHSAETTQPNFIIVVFDALSAAHMSLYGYGRKTTPHIESFAKTATTFHHNYSPSNFTYPSTASLLTGVHPWSHRALDFFEFLLPAYERKNLFSLISSTHQSLAYTHSIHVRNILEQFRSDIRLLKPIEELVLFRANPLEFRSKNDTVLAEYAVKRWLEDYFSPSYSLFLSPLFTTLSTVLIPSEIDRDYQKQYPVGLSELEGYFFRVEDAVDWIIKATREAQAPFLGYFHLLPPHETYHPRAEFYNMFAGDGFRLPSKPKHFFSQGWTEQDLQNYCRLYDEYVAHADAEFGRLVDDLEKQGTLQNSYLILTSDHGQLFERGIHAHDTPVLYEPVIHIPLLIHAPGQTEGTDVFSPTSLVDLVPTILQLGGQKQTFEFEGQLLPSFGGVEDSGRVLFSSHTRRSAKMTPLATVTLAAIQWPYKLIEYRGYQGLDNFVELFDLENDPDELRNLASEKPAIVATLREALRQNQTRAEEKSLTR